MKRTDDDGASDTVDPSRLDVSNQGKSRLLATRGNDKRRREITVIDDASTILNLEILVAAREKDVLLREDAVSLREREICAAEMKQVASEDHMIVLQQANAHLVIATIESTKLAEQLRITKDQLEIAKAIAEKANLALCHNITELKETERQLENSQHLLRQLAARNETAREDERKSLAREAHDELGQYLMALRINMTAVGLTFGENNPALQKEVSRLIALLDTTIQVVRNIVVSLRPSVLDMGVVPALEWLVDDYQKLTKTHCALHILGEDIYLDDKRATAVFRIVQESLTNIGRHAQASEVEIVLKQKEKQYELEVRDNGNGFDPAERKDKSFGLVGMQERALMLGGELEITSAPECGTVIKVSIPVNYVWGEEE